MNEHSALEVIAVRAIETQDRGRTVWSDAERAWASRAAAEVVGEKADADTFLARRANLVMERLGERNRALREAVRVMRWHPWHGWAIVAGAFALGFVIDRMSGGQRVNLLAPPVLALIGWNLAVYLVLLTTRIFRISKPSVPGLLRRMSLRFVGLVPWRSAFRSAAQVSGNNIIFTSIAKLADTWLALALPLYTARIGRILHLAAAALALGVIIGLYARGLSLEYRATWESTFLDANTVHAWLAAILGPGAWLSGIPVPDAAHMRSIHAPASGNAAAWLHLFAASVLLIVLIPRIALALLAWHTERIIARRFPISLDDPYFQHLLRGFHAGPVRVRVVPFSYTMHEAAQVGLESIVTHCFGGSTSLVLEPPVRWDSDIDAVLGMATAGQGPVIVLFNISATPEEEVHGAFIEAFKSRFHTGHTLIAVVDESPYHARWPGDEIRIAQRRRTWSELLDAHRLPVVYANLVAPDLNAVNLAIDAALNSQVAGTVKLS